jgi:hypothetical protein
VGAVVTDARTTPAQRAAVLRTAGLPAGTVLYAYGPLAWFWRVLMLFGAALGCGAAYAAVAGAGALLWVAAAAMLVPSAFFGFVLATRVEAHGEWLHVRTLLGMRRRIAVERLGARKVARVAFTDTAELRAPRQWQFVDGALPIHLDLLATIPDRAAFERVFGALPR